MWEDDADVAPPAAVAGSMKAFLLLLEILWSSLYLRSTARPDPSCESEVSRRKLSNPPFLSTVFMTLAVTSTL